MKRDNYDALRSVLFQIFSQGLSFPSWMKEKDIVKVRCPTRNMGVVGGAGSRSWLGSFVFRILMLKERRWVVWLVPSVSLQISRLSFVSF